jgi:hypothetical protein
MSRGNITNGGNRFLSQFCQTKRFKEKLPNRHFSEIFTPVLATWLIRSELSGKRRLACIFPHIFLGATE